ncbi:MAG: LamG domain-containing protein [candidate division WOR-3 bacterium]
MSHIISKPNRFIKPRFEWRPRLIPEHPLSQGLILFLIFNEGAGTKLYDLSPKGHMGLLSDFNFNANSGWCSEKFGVALKCDGVNDIISITDYSQCLAPPSLTFVANLRILSYSQNDRIVTKKPNLSWNANSGWSLEVVDGSTFVFLASGGSYTGNLTIPWSTDEWFQIAIVKKEGESEVYGYKNGLYQDSQTVGDPIVANDQSLVLCAYPFYDMYSNIIIDHVRVYNRALSSSEIQELYLNPFCNLEIPVYRKYWYVTEEAPSFNPAWAKQSNVFIGSGAIL